MTTAYTIRHAQHTIHDIPYTQPRKHNRIFRLLDRRYAGQAVGVGTAKIVGKIHTSKLMIGSQYFGCSFTIIEQESMKFLFGLDMLKKHRVWYCVVMCVVMYVM